jgi:hypothetical protein
MVEASEEQHSPYAIAILCNLLGFENSHVFRFKTVYYICSLAMYCFSLIVILFCFLGLGNNIG